MQCCCEAIIYLFEQWDICVCIQEKSSLKVRMEISVIAEDRITITCRSSHTRTP